MGGFFFEFEAVRCSAQAKQLDLLQAEVDQEEQLFGDEQLTAEEKQQHELSKKILAMALCGVLSRRWRRVDGV